MADRIAQQLGVTEAGLRVLAKLAAGHAAWGGNAGHKLVEQGYVSLDETGTYHHAARITDAGREVVRKARAMGW